MILDLIKFILTIPFVFILPGFFLLLAFFGWKNPKISFFERAILIIPMSLLSIDFLVLALNRLGIILKGPVLIGVILAFSLLCYIVFSYRHSRKKPGKEESSADFFYFSYWQTIFILISIFLAIFIRTIYLTDTIIPSSTDLGHHMFWAQEIIDTGKLPTYGMPDFIVGEHIIFAVFNLISGASLLGAMPILVLLLFNVTSIFTLSILAGRIFQSPKITATIFFITGALYAINAPQGKYVSGGVVGNVLGNMLIPVALYFLYRAFYEKDSIFAGLFIFSTAGIIYTHHLSAFVLFYSIAAIILIHLFLNFKRFFQLIGDWFKIFLKPFPLMILLVVIFCFFFVSIPSYFNSAAISQATGKPTKITRVGLGFEQLEANIGSARIILGALGLFLLLAFSKKRDYKFSFVFAWAVILLIISWKPAWLYVNVPSNRIGNYLFLPFSLLSAFGLVKFIKLFRKSATPFFTTSFLFILLFFVITSGMADSNEAFKIRPQFQEALETFHSAEYLSQKIDPHQDVLLKDHVNIYADSWYKLFFMKDYNYPLSRGMLFRYVDPTKPRETCTRDMITEPESENAKKCFAETGVNYIALNAQLEGSSFEKYPEFSKIYESNYISIFRRN